MLDNLLDRIRLPFRKDRKSYLLFYQILGFFPRNISYYQMALMHRSYDMGNKNANGQHVNNERLEFLGDAILDAVVGDIVYRYFEGRKEGFLTNTRSKIVQRETLNRVAVEIGLDKLVKYSNHVYSHNNYMYGNAFEAVVGAIYLDRGYEKCMQFMQEKILKQHINIERMSEEEMNFKSKLIEWCQKNRFQISFPLESESQDKDGNPIFRSTAMVEGIELGSGMGYSKKESQQKAAEEAIKTIQSRKRAVEYINELKTVHLAEQAASEQQESAPNEDVQEESSKEKDQD